MPLLHQSSSVITSLIQWGQASTPAHHLSALLTLYFKNDNLVKKRLEEAYFLMAKKHQKPNDIYLDLGFESLSHFWSLSKNNSTVLQQNS
jgi:AraC-like DNA-binding protein